MALTRGRPLATGKPELVSGVSHIGMRLVHGFKLRAYLKSDVFSGVKKMRRTLAVVGACDRCRV